VLLDGWFHTGDQGDREREWALARNRKAEKISSF